MTGVCVFQAVELEGKLRVKEEKMASLVETMQEMEERLEQLTAESERSAAATSSSVTAAAPAADKVVIKHDWLWEENAET